MAKQKFTRKQNKVPCLRGWSVTAQGSLPSLLEQCQLWNSAVLTLKVSVLHLTDTWARLLEGNTDTPETPTQDCVKWGFRLNNHPFISAEQPCSPLAYRQKMNSSHQPSAPRCKELQRALGWEWRSAMAVVILTPTGCVILTLSLPRPQLGRLLAEIPLHSY